MKTLLTALILGMATLSAPAFEGRAAASETIAYDWCFVGIYHCYYSAQAKARELQSYGYCVKITVTPCGRYAVYYAHH